MYFCNILSGIYLIVGHIDFLANVRMLKFGSELRYGIRSPNVRTPVDIPNFFRLFKYGGRVGKGIVKFCHPLQGANISMRLVQNSLRYVNIMNFESILGVFLFKAGMFQRFKN